jgi:O-antigen ligase
MPINKQTFRYAFLFIFLAELISFFSYLHPAINKLGFLVIVLITLIISLFKLEYGLLILLAELFIGSKGYLFYFEQGGLILSIRIALWLIIFSVWLAKFSLESVKNKKLDFTFLKNGISPYFFILFIFIVLSVWRGIAVGNSLNNIFFDTNGWMYFILIFPIFDIFYKSQIAELKENNFIKLFLAVFTASVLWLCLETYFLLFAYSHNLFGITYDFYRWIRNTGIGEITFIQGGFYRIFFQSHIYVLIATLISLLSVITANKRNDKNLYNKLLIFRFLLLIIFISIDLLTMSRSNWLGLAAGMIFIVLFFIWQKNWQVVKKLIFYFPISLLFGLIFIIAIVKFPYPNPLGGFNAADLLAERAGQISSEAGASSRWSLLPELWSKIKLSPILGQGFGATVIYKSSDPRVLESNPTGMYETYSFEWGLLDIWLKLGIFGLLSYLLLLYIIIFKSLKKFKPDDFLSIINIGFLSGLIAILITSVFSPYLNHPLGIGYLIIVSSIINKE